MNHVFLSGIAATSPHMISHENQSPHATVGLIVTHKTAAGVEKRETYPLAGWHGIAQRMCAMIKPGSRMSITGHLSQAPTPEGPRMEITVKEFQVSARSTPLWMQQENAAVPAEEAKAVQGEDVTAKRPEDETALAQEEA